MKQWIVFLLFFTFGAQAFEFKHLKVHPKIIDRLNLLTAKEFGNHLKNNHTDGADLPFDENLSPIYEEISKFLNGEYQTIGKSQIEGILKFNREFNLGDTNFSGFNWQKPMGKFAIGINRQILPYLFTDQVWVVSDTFTIYIDAKTFIKKLYEEGELTELSEKTLGAFAGLAFRRQIRFEHFASSYEEGLTSDLRKLFFGFTYFNPKTITNLSEYEIVSKNDEFTINAGAMGTSPSYYGFSLGAGALFKFNQMGEIKVQSLGKEDSPRPDEFLRLSSLKSKTTTVGLTAELQYEFLKLVKIKLFSYDFEYGEEKSQNIHISLFKNELADLQNTQNAKGKEFIQLLHLRYPEIKALKNNIVSLEQREKENQQSKIGALLFGRVKKKETEVVKIIKDNKTKTFFKSHFENIKVAQNFFSRVFNIATLALIDFNGGIKNDAIKSREVDIEYEQTEDMVKNDEVYVSSEEKISFQLLKSYMVKDTTGWTKKLYKKHAIEMMKDYSGLSGDLITMVRKDELHGPITIETSARVEKDGIRYFNQLSEDQIFYGFAIICESKRVESWKHEDFRKKELEDLQFGNENCVKNFGKQYLNYKEDYISNNREINFKKFRNILIDIHKKTDRKLDLAYFFGEGNIFFDGLFRAMTNHNRSFQTFFKEGTFKGLGVIDHYLREVN